MDIQKELKETTEILDKMVPFTNETKNQIFLKIEESKTKSPYRVSTLYHKLGVSVAVTLVSLTVLVGLSPIAAPYTEPILKLFNKEKEVSEVRTYHPVSNEVSSALDIEKEVEKISNSLKDGEVKAVYIRESNPGIARTDSKPYNLTTVIKKPIKMKSLELIENQIRNKTIQEYQTLILRKDQSDWRKGEDIKLPRQSVKDYNFSEGSISFRESDFDPVSLVEEAKRTGKTIITKDIPLTEEVSGLWFKYKNESSNFIIWLTFGQGAEGIEIPDLDQAVEVTKIYIGDSEAVYVNHGDSKNITWVEDIGGKKTKYHISSESLTKEDIIEVSENLF